MALQIKKNDDIFEIFGELTCKNVLEIKRHFQAVLEELDSIILSLDKVSYMDPGGAFTLEQIYRDFIKSDTIIQIIGKTNASVFDTMKETKTSYILSDDRI